MKEFLQISSNQITVFDPNEKVFILKSEIVISSFEMQYSLVRGEDNNAAIAKSPVGETFRFVADTKELISIIKRLSDEVKNHKKLAKEHSLDPKY